MANNDQSCVGLSWAKSENKGIIMAHDGDVVGMVDGLWSFMSWLMVS